MLFTNRWTPHLIAVAVFVAGIMMLSLQPSDLHQYSQPSTVGYTVDIIQHGRWILPNDVGGPATKPPMFNWFSVPFVKLFGSTVFVFKLPSVIAGLTVLLMLLLTAHFFIIKPSSATKIPGQQTSHFQQMVVMPLLAGLIWATLPLAIKMSYFARPDMLLCVFLTAAWLLSTHLIRSPDCDQRLLKQLMLWLSVAAAALTKGPAALLIILYIFIYSKCVHKRFSNAKSTGWQWGIVLSLGLTFIWLAAAYCASPKHVKSQLIGYELVNRVTGSNFISPQKNVVANQQSCVKPDCQHINRSANVMDIEWRQQRHYKAKHQRKWVELFKKPLAVATLFVQRFSPWVVLLIAWFVLLPSGKRRTHVGSAALIWIGLVLFMFCMPTVLRGRYLLPALPAATLLATSVLSHLIDVVSLRWAKTLLLTVVMLVCALMLMKGVQGVERANERLPVDGDNELLFVQQVQDIVDNEKIVFDYFVGSNNVQALLGYSQQKSPSQEKYQQAQWLIKPIDVKNGDIENVIIDSEPTLRSGYVTALTNATIKKTHLKHEPVILGLYKIGNKVGVTPTP